MKTAKLMFFLEQQGTEVIENLPNVHSNTSIERRHKDVIQIHHTQMFQGCAPDKLWEFSIPNANVIINLSMTTQDLRAAGRLAKHAQRPVTPFERMECDGQLIDMKVLWGNVYPMFTKCVGIYA